MSHAVLLVVTTFLASAVEAVEALTIVLAVGVVRGWRSTLAGAGAAALVLAAIVAALGPALGSIPIGTLRLVVGALLLAFGLQWLRKAILRTSGYRQLHDEAAAFARERDLAEGTAAAASTGTDWYSFTVAFKGVLLEGLEVTFIVVSFGSTQGRLGLAAAAAVAAVVLVVAVGLVVRAPLERVPENTLKFVVGLLLTSFGIFWAGEGAGVRGRAPTSRFSASSRTSGSCRSRSSTSCAGGRLRFHLWRRRHEPRSLVRPLLVGFRRRRRPPRCCGRRRRARPYLAPRAQGHLGLVAAARVGRAPSGRLAPAGVTAQLTDATTKEDTHEPRRVPLTDHLLTPENAALIIIDYQPVQVTSVASMDRRTLVLNVVAVAETAKLYGLPIVLSTVNVHTGKNAPTIRELIDVIGDIEAFDRTSINAWEDVEFVSAVKATERKKQIMTALWTEACLTFPTLDALRDGYEVYPVVDAVGGTSRDAHRAALERMVQAGAQPVTWVQLLCELQRD